MKKKKCCMQYYILLGEEFVFTLIGKIFAR